MHHDATGASSGVRRGACVDMDVTRASPRRVATLQLRENRHDAADLRSRSFSLSRHETLDVGWQVVLNTHIATCIEGTVASDGIPSVYVVVLV